MGAFSLLTRPGAGPHGSNTHMKSVPNLNLWKGILGTKENTRLFFSCLNGFLQDTEMIESGEAAKAATVIASVPALLFSGSSVDKLLDIGTSNSASESPRAPSPQWVQNASVPSAVVACDLIST